MTRVCYTSHCWRGWVIWDSTAQLSKPWNQDLISVNQPLSWNATRVVFITQKQGIMECKKNTRIYPWNITRTQNHLFMKIFIFGLYVPGFVTCPPLFGGLAMALDLMIIHLWNAMFKGGIHREPWQLTWNLDEPYFLMGRLSSISRINMAMENHHGLRGDTSTQMVFPIVMLVFKGVKHRSRLPERLAKGHHVRYLETPFAARPHDCYDVVICLLKSTGFVGPPDKEPSHSLDRGWKEKKRTQNWLFHVLLLLYPEGFFSFVADMFSTNSNSYCSNYPPTTYPNRSRWYLWR